jgi:hypothetical protein
VIKRIRQSSKLTLKKRYEKMFQKNFNKPGLTAIAMISAMAFAPASNAALGYSTDFESFVTGDVEDFKIGNIVNGGAWWGGIYGAPGDYNNGYSAIVNEGGVPQGDKQLSVFSDYNPWSPFTAGPGTEVQAFVYRDAGFIDASDVGTTMTFSFDAKLGNLAAPSQAEAFIKVLDAVGGTYDEWVNLTFDSDANLTTDWSGGSVSFLVDASLIGQLVQIGFNNTGTVDGAGVWPPTGVVYDNLCLGANCGAPAVPVPAAVWLFGSGLLGLVGVARRRKA